MVHAATSTFQFRSKGPTRVHLPVNVFRINAVVLLGSLGNSELSLILQVRELFRRGLLVCLGFQKVNLDVVLEPFHQLFTEYLGLFVDGGKGKSRVMADREDVIGQMGKPDVTKLSKLSLRLFRERGHEEAAGDTGCISYGPTFILKAVQ
jgi:hypothetical protein